MFQSSFFNWWQFLNYHTDNAMNGLVFCSKKQLMGHITALPEGVLLSAVVKVMQVQ